MWGVNASVHPFKQIDIYDSNNKFKRKYFLIKNVFQEKFRMLYNEEICDLYRSVSTVGSGVVQSV
jgi:hypothetical protein